MTKVKRTSGMALFLAVLGCGLADYESRIDEQQARLTRFDAREKYLDVALEPPTKQVPGKEPAIVWPFEVFMRLPHGFRRSVHDEVYKFNSVTLYRYQKPKGFNIFIAAMKVGEKNKKGVYKEGELSAEEFRHQVRGALAEYYRKEYKSDVNFPSDAKPVKDPPRQPDPDPVPVRPLEFESLAYADNPRAKNPNQYLLFFHRQGLDQVAIVFEAPKDKVDAEFQRAVDYTLKSLSVGESAKQRRADFKRMRG